MPPAMDRFLHNTVYLVLHLTVYSICLQLQKQALQGPGLLSETYCTEPT